MKRIGSTWPCEVGFRTEPSMRQATQQLRAQWKSKSSQDRRGWLPWVASCFKLGSKNAPHFVTLWLGHSLSPGRGEDSQGVRHSPSFEVKKSRFWILCFCRPQTVIGHQVSFWVRLLVLISVQVAELTSLLPHARFSKMFESKWAATKSSTTLWSEASAVRLPGSTLSRRHLRWKWRGREEPATNATKYTRAWEF